MSCRVVLSIYAFFAVMTMCLCQQNMDVRLVAGTQPSNGRVQVYYKHPRRRWGEWGGVCQNGWNMDNARVVCRELGYKEPILFTKGLFYGRQRVRRIWLDRVQCSGSERRLRDCPHREMGRVSCSTTRLAGVMCKPGPEGLLKQPPPPPGNVSNMDIKLFPLKPADRKYDDVISEGVLKVKHLGTWRRVCRDGWDLRDARVACGQLGFSYADMNTAVYRNYRRMLFIMTKVQCTGREVALLSCKHSGLGSQYCRTNKPVMLKCSTRASKVSQRVQPSDQTVSGPCNQRMDTNTATMLCNLYGFGTMRKVIVKGEKKQGPYTIRCSATGLYLEACGPGQTYPCEHYDVHGQCNLPTTKDEQFRTKLFQLKLDSNQTGDVISEGLLGVRYGKGRWGAVCSDGWDTKDAVVACGQLGFPRAEMNDPITSSSQASWKNAFILSDVQCTGTESSLFSCRSAGLGFHSCLTGTPVMLKCSRAKPKIVRVRLKGGLRPSEGRVEIISTGTNDEWSTVCDKGMNMATASVMCRSLGYGTAYEYALGSVFPKGTSEDIYDEVNCKGNEPYAELCKWTKGRYRSPCRHYNDVGVKCNVPKSNRKKDFKTRLANGARNYLGRVEVSLDGRWGMVCGDHWTMKDAMVVCRELGLGYATNNFTSDHQFGRRGNTLVSGVTCFGNETSLDMCLRHKNVTCSSNRSVAGVRCQFEISDLVWDVEELSKTLGVQSFTLGSLRCAYDENCLASGADHYMKASIFRVQRQLLRFSAKVHNVGSAAYRPYRRPDDWEWHSCHQHYHSDEEFAIYDLMDPVNHIKIAEGHKASYCLEDTFCDEGVEKFFNCTGRQEQGISVNCHDNYDYTLDCQWIDLSDITVKRTDYLLRLVANPSYKVGEADFSNNVVLCNIRLKLYRGRFHDIERRRTCWLEDCAGGVRSHRGKGNFACCKFPFVYLGKTYHTCVESDTSRRFWCSTTSNYDRDQLWGYC